MSHTKLTRIIQDGVASAVFTTNATYPMKSKQAVRSAASRKAWKVRKRQAKARAQAAQEPTGDKREAA